MSKINFKYSLKLTFLAMEFLIKLLALFMLHKFSAGNISMILMHENL